MAFTTKLFPNKVFESFEEYNDYLLIRDKIKKKLKDKKENKTRTVKVSRVVKDKDKKYQKIYECLLKLAQSSE